MRGHQLLAVIALAASSAMWGLTVIPTSWDPVQELRLDAAPGPGDTLYQKQWLLDGSMTILHRSLRLWGKKTL